MSNDGEPITRLIIPAPIETARETGLQWYEVFAPPQDPASPLRPRPSNPKGMPVLEARMSPGGMAGVITEERANVQIEAQLTTEDGRLHIQVVINGQDGSIYGDPANPASITVSGGIDVGPDEQRAITQ